MIVPDLPPARIKLAVKKSGGFIYYVSRTGVTGGEAEISKELKGKVREIKRAAGLPVCVGFGISNREQLLEVWQYSDGAIVGSALVKPFLEKRGKETGLKQSLQFLDSLLGVK